jgi:hypothetical protein
MEHDLDYYVLNLGSNIENQTEISLGIFQQSIIYPEKPNPIQKTHTLPTKIINKPQKYTNTHSLWCGIAGCIDELHLIQTPIMKKQNVQVLIDTLKNYLSEQVVHSFLSGRRVYPLMELLDKPSVEFEKKHQYALGFFISFLLNQTIYIIDTQFKWSNDCHDGSIRLMKKPDGFWFVEKK